MPICNDIMCSFHAAGARNTYVFVFPSVVSFLDHLRDTSGLIEKTLGIVLIGEISSGMAVAQSRSWPANDKNLFLLINESN